MSKASLTGSARRSWVAPNSCVQRGAPSGVSNVSVDEDSAAMAPVFPAAIRPVVGNDFSHATLPSAFVFTRKPLAPAGVSNESPPAVTFPLLYPPRMTFPSPSTASARGSTNPSMARAQRGVPEGSSFATNPRWDVDVSTSGPKVTVPPTSPATRMFPAGSKAM